MKLATAIAIILLLIVAFFILRGSVENDQIPEAKERSLPRVVTPIPPRPAVLGDTMLADYASEESSGKEDLEMMARFLDSVFLLVKSRDSSEYSTNEDLVLFLKGGNSHQSPFLNGDSSALNHEGQLIDRWGIPIIVHPVSQKLLELRSAGPDQKAYTDDDFIWPRS